MSEVEALKAQVAALEKLVQLKDQTIAHLQSYPRNNWYQPSYPYSPFWTVTANTGSQNTLTAVSGGSSL